MTYKDYCRQMRSFKQKPMSEIQFNEMMGITAEVVSLSVIPKRNARKVEPTLKNYEVAAPKKPKAVKEPRVVMTEEEARLRRNELRRKRYDEERISLRKKKRKILTDEDRKESKRKYMKLWRLNNPTAQAEANKRWREAHPEKHREQRRKEAARRREKRRENKL